MMLGKNNTIYKLAYYIKTQNNVRGATLTNNNIVLIYADL